MPSGYVPSTPEAQFAAWRNRVEARLEKLETANAVSRASIRNGSLLVQDPNGDTIACLGDLTYKVSGGLTRDGTVVAAKKPNSTVYHLLIDGEDGWVRPNLQTSFSPATGVSTTATSYTDVWKAPFVLLGEVLQCALLMDVGASTTGSVRLLFAGVESDAYSVVGSVTGERKVFAWNLHDRMTLGTIGLLTVQAKVDESASNSVTIYAPEECTSLSRRMVSTATSGGLPDE